MILLSNVIKSATYIPATDKKMLELVEVSSESPPNKEDEKKKIIQAAEQEAEERKKQIISDAEMLAEQHLAQAKNEAKEIKEKAQAEIESWWEERRQQDQATFDEAAERGYSQGLDEGKKEAEAQVRKEYEDFLKEAKSILLLAQQQKEAMIGQAEPFLVELATAIAEKIVAKQLTIEPEWIVQLASSVLARRKEQGTITLCVSPSYYAQINDAREELIGVIDSQAELLILPDSTVQDHGCVVRSTYGSIDARVDTQLSEIKAALLDIANRNEVTAEDVE